MEGAAFGNFYFFQKIGQPTDGCGFCSAFFTANQYTAQSGVNEIQNQCQLHLVLTNDSGEGIIMFHDEYTPLRI